MRQKEGKTIISKRKKEQYSIYILSDLVFQYV